MHRSTRVKQTWHTVRARRFSRAVNVRSCDRHASATAGLLPGFAAWALEWLPRSSAYIGEAGNRQKNHHAPSKASLPAIVVAGLQSKPQTTSSSKRIDFLKTAIS